MLAAASNSSGGVMGKMIDAQSIVVAGVATGQQGQEGAILRQVFWHSLALAGLVGVLVLLQAYVFPWMIPRVAATRTRHRAPRTDQSCFIMVFRCPAAPVCWSCWSRRRWSSSWRSAACSARSCPRPQLATATSGSSRTSCG